MKTTRVLTLTGLFLSLFALVSCHKNDLANASDAANGTNSESTNNTTLPDCDSYCINADGPYVKLSGSQTSSWGSQSNPHTKTVSYDAYNTPTSFVVEVTFVHSGGNASDLVSVTALGSTQSVATLASGSTAIFTFALPEGWAKCDNVSFSIGQVGQSAPINISASYSLYGVCLTNKGCETSFSGETISCSEMYREAVYTFIASEDQDYFKIQGGLTNFTGEDAIVEISGGNDIEDSQSTPGGSTNRVIKVEGKATACEPIIIRVKWNSTNSGGVITGSWSVKDANGVEIAPAVSGLTCN